MKDLKEFSELLSNLKTEKEIIKFFSEIFTSDEISLLSKRWRILDMLSQGITQREIAKKLNVSLCKITRGAKILKDKNTIVYKYFIKEKNHDTKNKL